MIVTLTDEF